MHKVIGHSVNPCYRPKKAVEGLLRHLQKKWEPAVQRLGSSYELHLVGLVSEQEDKCLSWTGASVNSALTVRYAKLHRLQQHQRWVQGNSLSSGLKILQQTACLAQSWLVTWCLSCVCFAYSIYGGAVQDALLFSHASTLFSDEQY